MTESLALTVSVRTIRQIIAAGEVRVIRFGRLVRVPMEDVDRIMGRLKPSESAS